MAVLPVLHPLDVHGPAVVVLDGEGLAAELLEVVVRQGEAAPIVGGDGNTLDASVRAVDHLLELGAELPGEHGWASLAKSTLVQVDLVWVYGPLNQELAKAVRGRDEDGAVEARLGVQGERHPAGADVAARHALHAG